MMNDLIPKDSVFYESPQVPVVLLAFISGFFCAVVYDIIKVKNKYFGKGTFLAAADDFFIVMLLYFLLFTIALNLNSGRIRWYDAASAVFGALICRKTLSRVLVPFLDGAVSLLIKIVSRLIHILLLPARMILMSAAKLSEKLGKCHARIDAKRRYYREKRKLSALAERGFGLADE